MGCDRSPLPQCAIGLPRRVGAPVVASPPSAWRWGLYAPPVKVRSSPTAMAHHPIPQASPEARRARRAEEILHAVEARPEDLAVLLSAAPECAAISFGVHPETVLAARALATSRGISAPERS
jgi:hypothetical protein